MYPEEFTEGFGNQSTNLAEDFQKRKAAGVMSGTFRPIQSGLPIAQYQAFVNNEVKAQAEAAETNGFGAAVMNGLKSGVRGLLGAAKAGVDYNIALHQKNDPNYKPVNDWAFGISDTLQSGIDKLQREEINADSTAGQLMYDLTEGAVQLAIQAGVTLATGGAGGAIYMGANIAGDQYLDLRKEGVDVERAAQAGLMNAPFQAMLERAGMSKILAKIPAGQGLKKKLGEVLKTGFDEGITEGLQELPEQFTNIWAKDKNATPESMAAKWGKNWEQNVKEVGYSALIGGILGGGAKGLHIVTDSVRRNIGEKVNEVKKEQLVNQAERVGKSGVNLDYAAAAIDANSQGETISVEAKDVKAFMQQTNGEKLAERLGVTVEQIEEAANLGQDIDIGRGEYVAAMSENKGFYEATQGGMYFGVDGELAANARENLKTLKNDMHFTEEVTAQLNTELDAIIKSATEAGMGKQHAENLRLMIESRAIIANPENPAAWLQKNKLRFEDGGKAKKNNGWFQKSGELNKAKFYNTNITGNEMGHYTDLKDLRKKATDWYKNNLQGTKVKNSVLGEIRIGKGFTDNDIALTGSGKRKMTTTSAKAEKLLAVRYLKEIIEGSNFVTEAASHKEKHSGENFYYIHSALNVNGEKRYVVVTARELNNKELVYYNHNIFNESEYKKIEDALRPSDSTISNAGQYSEQQSSFADSVSQKADNYKQQKIVNGTLKDKGMISPMDDGTYVITLFKGADASTVIHETGHYFADTMIKEAIEDPSNTRLVRDAKILLEYGGMTIEQWQNASIDEKRAAHEKFAEAFETYLMEGKSPSVGLRGVFQRFSKWLTAIYSKIARSENAAELNDDVRGVFDRMLASQEEIEMQAQLNGILGELPAELTSKLDDKAKNTLQDKIMGAKDKAVDILTKKMMQDFNARRKAEKAAYIKEITPKVEETIHNQKVNQAREQVGYWFGKEGKTNYPTFKNINGMAHANAQVKRWNNANASIIARKYRHAIGSVLPNYNDVLQDTKAAVNDRLNPIIESLKSDIERYETELAENSDDKVRGVRGHWEYHPENSVFTGYMDESNSNGFADAAWVKGQYAEDGKWTDRAIERAEVDGYVFVPASDGLANLNWYGRYVEENGHKKPTKAELRDIAESIYRGEDVYGILDRERALYGGGGLEEKTFYEQQAKELDDLQKEINYLEKNPEGVDLVKMSKRSALSDEQRQQFEMIAEELGYSSGDEMAQDILNNPSERQMVRQLIDEAVQKRFPDIYKERELAEQAAREALYNDESGEVIALEHELIAGYLDEALDSVEYRQRAKAFAQMAKVKAKEIISSMSVGDITKGNGKKFMLAERRAAANAAKAIKDGDLVMAEYNKQQQLINHELYRQALQIRGKVESAQRFIRKMARMKKENFGTEQHFNQIASLLERMGINRRGYNRNGDNQFLPGYVEEMKSKCGEIVDIPDFVLNEQNDLSDAMGMSFEHYEDVVNALKNIYAIAKYDTKMSKLGKEQSFADTKAEIMANLDKLDNVYTPRLGGDKSKGWRKTFAESFRNYASVLRNADNFYLAMDNWTDGYFTKHWYDTLNHCADEEATMMWDYQEKSAKALAKWEPDKETAKEHDTDRYYEELGTSTDKHTLINMLCNLGNKGNMERLCSTPPVGIENRTMWVKESELVNREQAIEMTRQNLVTFLSKNLTKADIEYAQAKIEACGAYWPQVRDLNIRTKGFAPPAVEATPITLKLSDGSSVFFRGGYFPLVRDSRMGSAHSGQNRLSATDEYAGAGISTMKTDAASSKGRTNANYPVKLDRGVEVTAISDTIHDICYREAMLDFRKILNDAEIFATLKRKLGEQNVKLLREQLEACANPYSNQQTAQAETLVSKAFDSLRNVATNTAIMLNLKTAIQNYSNIVLYGNSVEGFTHADALRALHRGFTGQGRAEVDAICRKSAFMRERMEVPDITLRDIKNRNDLNPVERNTLKFGAKLLGYTDMITAKPVFAEAYMKKINEGASEQVAIDFANRVIRRTLGSSRKQDVSSLQRGSKLFRLFTMFQGFFNTQFNQWDREFHIVRNLLGAGENKEAIERIISFVAAKWLGACLLNVALGELSLTAPFEKDKDGWGKLSKELINYPLSMGGPVGQATNVAVQNLLGMKNYGYRLTATQGLIDKGFTVFRRTNQVLSGEKEISDLAEPLSYTVGAALGVPGSVFNWVFNGIDIINGTMDPELADLLRRRPKDERKPETQLEKEKKNDTKN